MQNSNYTARIPHYFCTFTSHYEERICKYIWHRGTSATFWGRIKDSPARCRVKKEGNGCTYFDWPEQFPIDIFPFLICLQSNNYGSYRPRAFKETFQNLLPRSQQSHGFFKANLQEVKVGESREALFKQVWLTYEDELLSHLCWESARDTRHQEMAL